MTLDARLGQVALNLPGRKNDAAAVVGLDGDGLGDALIDGQKLVVAQIEMEANDLVGHKDCAGGDRHSETD